MAGESNPSNPQSAAIPQPQVFACPSCGAPLTVRALGQTLAVACGSCGSVVDVRDEKHQILSRAQKAQQLVPVIPLGSRGKLKGFKWEVIGYLLRTDNLGVYEWEEYLLFNPMKGFRWLSCAEGHWNLFVQIKTVPTANRNTASAFNKTYQIFHRGGAKVSAVLGEFYWLVKVGDSVSVEDYISPPEILSKEKNGTEVTWSLGEYIPAAAVREAFQVKSYFPQSQGVAPNQPSELRGIMPMLAQYWGMFFVLLFLIQMYGLMKADNKLVFSQRFVYSSTDPEKVKVTAPFQIGKGNNVEFTLSSPVSNNWFEVGIDLINDETGESYDVEQGVEYYSGYDDEGSWSEGSGVSQKQLPFIPAGTYHLSIEPAQMSHSSLPYTIEVRRDVPNGFNFFIGLIFISIFPLVVWWRNRTVEMRRWSNSDFSPYPQHHDSGDS